MVAVAGHVCGVQAQVMSAAELALRTRVRGLRRQDVREALWRDRTLVKTWCMRGTVHLLPSTDLPVFLRGLRQRESRTFAWLVRGGLSAQGIEDSVRAIVRALRDGPLLRRELADRVGRDVGAMARRWVAHSWGGVVRVACARGLVCFGPDRGNEVSFVRMEDWLPSWEDLPVPEAEAQLLKRYLRAYGPATRADYGLWTNLAAAEVREAWAMVEGSLAPTETGGRPGWMLQEDLGAMKRTGPEGPVVRLLPNFDVLLLGHRDKSHLVAAVHYKRVYRKAGWLSPTILVDGRVLGVWSHRRTGERLEVILEPFHHLSKAVWRGVEAEVEDLSRFLEASRSEMHVS